MISEGADIIDIGGESTRPGAQSISEDEEKRRVIPVIEEIRKFSDIPISIDTYKSAVAREAVQSGADFINDISGLRFDTEMVNVAMDHKIPVIVMHIKGTPRDMQKNPFYEDLMRELLEYFEERINTLNKAGVDKIIIDPGIGFGKRLEDNLKIIKNLNEFSIFNLPVMIGVSRKSFIGNILDRTVEERLTGTIAANAMTLLNGANILRVHDVKPHKELIKMFEAINQ
jgi:dihydropteroate synthase